MNQQRKTQKEFFKDAYECRDLGNAEYVQEKGISDFFFYFLGYALDGQNYDRVVQLSEKVLREYECPESAIKKMKKIAKQCYDELYG